MIAHYDKTLFVNPGSATLPAHPGYFGLGTVAILNVRNGIASVEVKHLRKQSA
jgi:hypothetical protein